MREQGLTATRVRPFVLARERLRGRFSERTLILVALYVAALAGAAALFRPWTTPAMGPDSAASVLYFDRLVAGQRLEAFIGTTPKPAVTLLYGLAFNLFHDWRALSFLATIEYPLMVAAAAALAWRSGGPVAAGMTAMGLFGARRLLQDGALTYATPWAVLAWVVAGLLLDSKRPRYGLAGLALFIGALLRVETFLILALAAAALLAWRGAPIRWSPASSGPPARAYLLLVGFLALPVMILHDWLLTGTGFYWLDVSSIVSGLDPSAVATPSELARTLVAYYATAWPLVLLAAVGVADLVRRRRVVIVLGLLACGPGVLAFLEFLATRDTYVSYRYTIPADAALVFASAIGAGALARAAVAIVRLWSREEVLPSHRGASAVRAPGRLAVAAAAVAIGAVAAVGLSGPNGRVGSAVVGTIDAYRGIQADYDLVLPDLASAVRSLPDQPAWTVTNVLQFEAGPPPRLYVPPLMDSRAAVDLGLPFWAVRGGSPLDGDPAAFRVAVPEIAYLDASHSGNPAFYRPLEVDRTTRVGQVTVEPLLVLPSRGLWIVELIPAA